MSADARFSGRCPVFGQIPRATRALFVPHRRSSSTSSAVAGASNGKDTSGWKRIVEAAMLGGRDINATRERCYRNIISAGDPTGLGVPAARTGVRELGRGGEQDRPDEEHVQPSLRLSTTHPSSAPPPRALLRLPSILLYRGCMNHRGCGRRQPPPWWWTCTSRFGTAKSHSGCLPANADERGDAYRRGRRPDVLQRHAYDGRGCGRS